MKIPPCPSASRNTTLIKNSSTDFHPNNPSNKKVKKNKRRRYTSVPTYKDKTLSLPKFKAKNQATAYHSGKQNTIAKQSSKEIVLFLSSWKIKRSRIFISKKCFRFWSTRKIYKENNSKKLQRNTNSNMKLKVTCKWIIGD